MFALDDHDLTNYERMNYSASPAELSIVGTKIDSSMRAQIKAFLCSLMFTLFSNANKSALAELRFDKTPPY